MRNHDFSRDQPAAYSFITLWWCLSFLYVSLFPSFSTFCAFIPLDYESLCPLLNHFYCFYPLWLSIFNLKFIINFYINCINSYFKNNNETGKFKCFVSNNHYTSNKCELCKCKWDNSGGRIGSQVFISCRIILWKRSWKKRKWYYMLGQ